MTNKEVEKKVREHYCLRTCDKVDVEFLYSISGIEYYNVTDYIEQNNKDYVRESEVAIKGDKFKCTIIE